MNLNPFSAIFSFFKKDSTVSTSPVVSNFPSLLEVPEGFGVPKAILAYNTLIQAIDEKSAHCHGRKDKMIFFDTLKKHSNFFSKVYGATKDLKSFYDYYFEHMTVPFEIQSMYFPKSLDGFNVTKQEIELIRNYAKLKSPLGTTLSLLGELYTNRLKLFKSDFLVIESITKKNPRVDPLTLINEKSAKDLYAEVLFCIDEIKKIIGLVNDYSKFKKKYNSALSLSHSNISESYDLVKDQLFLDFAKERVYANILSSKENISVYFADHPSQKEQYFNDVKRFKLYIHDLNKLHQALRNVSRLQKDLTKTFSVNSISLELNNILTTLSELFDSKRFSQSSSLTEANQNLSYCLRAVTDIKTAHSVEDVKIFMSHFRYYVGKLPACLKKIRLDHSFD